MLPFHYLDKGTDCADAQACIYFFFIFMCHVLADNSSGTRGLNFGLSHTLYFASIWGSGESAHLCRLS